MAPGVFNIEPFDNILTKEFFFYQPYTINEIKTSTKYKTKKKISFGNNKRIKLTKTDQTRIRPDPDQLFLMQRGKLITSTRVNIQPLTKQPLALSPHHTPPPPPISWGTGSPNMCALTTAKKKQKQKNYTMFTS